MNYRLHAFGFMALDILFIQHVFVHLLSGTGAFHRLSFVGGKAYGIPLKTYAVDLIPRTGPQSVFTIIGCSLLSILSSKMINILTVLECMDANA
jgi:hypothetical protein